MIAMTVDFSRSSAGYSPDRVDALVWCLVELMIGANSTGLIEFYRREVETAKVANGQPPLLLPAPTSGTSPGTVTLLAPPGISTVYTMSGAQATVAADGTITCTPEDAKPLKAAGWQVITGELTS